MINLAQEIKCYLRTLSVKKCALNGAKHHLFVARNFPEGGAFLTFRRIVRTNFSSGLENLRRNVAP